MDLRRFAALRAVVEEGSFVRAARRLCCTQSTVTFQIRQLEQELGMQLFEKVGRCMRLTGLGQEILPQVRQITDSLESLKATASRGEARGELRLAVGESLLAYVLPHVLGTFRRQAPGVRLTLQALNCYLIHDALLAGEVDAGIFYSVGESPSILQEELGSVPLVLVAAPQMANTMGLDFTRPDQRLPVSLIINEAHCIYRLMFEHQLRKRNIVLDHTLELWSIESIKKCVTAGLGVSYLPLFTVEEELCSGALQCLPFANPQEQIMMVCTKHVNKSPSPALRLFWDLITSAPLWKEKTPGTGRKT